MVEDQRHPTAIPLLTLAAHLARALLKAESEKALLEFVAAVCGVLDENALHWQFLAPRGATSSGMRVEVIGADPPDARPALKRAVIVATRHVAKEAQRIRPADRVLDRLDKLEKRMQKLEQQK